MPLENEKRKKYICFGNVLTKLLWRSSLEDTEDKGRSPFDEFQSQK